MGKKNRVVMFYPYVNDKAPAAVEKLIKSRWIGQGQVVSDFENRIIQLTGAPHAVAVNHLSSALRLALAVAGVEPGDEVITTPQTCTATNHPILEQFASPVFADIEMGTGNINPEDIPGRITEKSKAIICAHWGGYPCDLDPIHQIARKHNLVVIEDAGDALGASYKGRAIGTISPFSCFSFQAIQQVTAAEGGMLCTTGKADFESALRRRWFGIDRTRRIPNEIGYYEFDITETGFGYHLTNIAAAIGLANLDDLDRIMSRREQIASRYTDALGNVDGITLFDSNQNRKSAWHLFSIHVRNRTDFCRALRSRGVETSIVHMRNDIYTVFGGKRNDLPVLDEFSESFISVPIHNQLSEEQVEQVIDAIKQGW